MASPDWNPGYEDPLNPGLIIHDYCSCEGEDHDYDCEFEVDWTGEAGPDPFPEFDLFN